jgi:hypothetical protein
MTLFSAQRKVACLLSVLSATVNRYRNRQPVGIYKIRQAASAAEEGKWYSNLTQQRDLNWERNRRGAALVARQTVFVTNCHEITTQLCTTGGKIKKALNEYRITFSFRLRHWQAATAAEDARLRPLGCDNGDSHVTVRATARQSPSSHTLLLPADRPQIPVTMVQLQDGGLKPLTVRFRFSQRCCQDVKSSGMWHCVGGWIAADLSKDRGAKLQNRNDKAWHELSELFVLQTYQHISLTAMYVMEHTVAGWTICNCATKSSSTSTQKPHFPFKHPSCLPIYPLLAVNDCLPSNSVYKFVWNKSHRR